MPTSDYSLGKPGDGRCLFRSVIQGACLRVGKPSPIESLQIELADELRAKVADEFIKRREDTEWFLEGDFDTYVIRMRQPHIWGGEPELLMSSHVLQMPITVYMLDKRPNDLKVIAEYGQEYGKENPICVLYHGYGHYDALLIEIEIEIDSPIRGVALTGTLEIEIDSPIRGVALTGTLEIEIDSPTASVES